MALEVGGAAKIYNRNQGIYDAVQTSPDFASFVGQNRGGLFGASVSNPLMPANLQTAAQSIGNPGLNNFLGGGVMTSTLQNAEKQEDAARFDFQSMANDELAQIVGGASLLNPGSLNLGGNDYTLNYSPRGNLLGPSLVDDSGGVWSSFGPDRTGGDLTFLERYDTLKNTPSDIWNQSQQSTYEHNADREAKFGLADLAVAIGKAGVTAGAFKASGLSDAISSKNPLKGLFGKLQAPGDTGFNLASSIDFGAANAAAPSVLPGLGSGASATVGAGTQALIGQMAGRLASGGFDIANSVPGYSTNVTTPRGGASLTGSGQAAPLLGVQGGAPLGANPLAVTAGANPLPGVQGLPTGGKIPGTNQIIGDQGNPPKVAQSGDSNLLKRGLDSLQGIATPQVGVTPVAENPSQGVAGTAPAVPQSAQLSPRYFDLIYGGDAQGGGDARRYKVARNWLAGKQTRGLPWQA